jgi:hypothetical protein
MSRTKHDAYASIAEGIKDGFLKDCTHLKVLEGEWQWHTICEEDSLIHSAGFRDRCPENCVFFKDKKVTEWEAVEAGLTVAVSKVLPKLATPITAFFKQPWQTQMLIVVSLFTIWALATHQLNTVLEIVRALRGSK